MGKMEKNGIVDVSSMFEIGPVEGDVYNREDDIILSGNADKPLEGAVEGKDTPGDNLNNDKPADIDPVDQNKPDDIKVQEDIKPVINYKGLIKSLSEKGAFIDLKDVKFGTEDGRELSLDEMEVNDENTFIDIVTSILENQKADLTADKIDVRTVSDFTKKLIEADKAGANILDILKQYDKTSAPVKDLNIDDKADQLKIIRHYINNIGLSKEDADEFYKDIISKGDDFIEARAYKYKADLDKRMDTVIAEQTRIAAEKKAEDAEKFKNYKKGLKANIQQKYQLNDSMVSKAMDFALKPSKTNPRVTEASERVRQMLMDPEQAPDLIMFLMNPDEFVKQKSNNRVVEEKKRTFRLISNTGKSRNSAPVDSEGDQVIGGHFEEIELK